MRYSSPKLPRASAPLGCGRIHLANGLVAEAKHEARCMLEVRVPHTRAERHIIGL